MQAMVEKRGSIPVLPKVCGADIELGNFILGLPEGITEGITGTAGDNRSGWSASRALLDEIQGVLQGELQGELNNVGVAGVAAGAAAGSDATTVTDVVVPSSSWTSFWADTWQDMAQADGTTTINLQDWGRKFLATNGGCVYIDLGHLELCIPEVISAFDHVACWHAMLKIAGAARRAASEGLAEGREIKVLANNSDGKGNAYGSHLNFLITRRCYENIFRRKLHHMLFLASYLASSILFTGAGKVGVEEGAVGGPNGNGADPNTDYQIAQRADFFKTLTGPQTTFDRPLINSRDESHAREDMARLHVIFFDSTLAHGSSLLKVGVTQIILAMVEQEYVDSRLVLEDPVRALKVWSADPDLQRTAPLATGERYTALDMQRALFDRASQFVSRGRADGLVPRVREIMDLWEDTLARLATDVSSLAGRIDWILKRSILDRAAETRGLAPGGPELRHLDQIYHSLDPGEGLFWAYHNQGIVERLVPEERIDHFLREPPEDTRAYARARLLRLGGRESVDRVDWDSIRFRIQERGYWPRYRTQELADPLAFTREETETAFDSSSNLDDVLDTL